MYQSQISEIKKQESKIWSLMKKDAAEFAPLFTFSEDEGKTNDQLKAESIAREQAYLNKIVRNLGELVAFGETNNLLI